MRRRALLCALLWAILCASLGSLLGGCEEPTYFSRSCSGERVLVCPAYGYALVEEATFEPSGLAPGDFSADAHITATLSTCGRDLEEGPYFISLVALVPGPTAAPQLVPILDLADDGGATDEVAGDGRIDATVTNPFERIVPESSDIELRFEPRVGSECRGRTLAIDYRTGRSP